MTNARSRNAALAMDDPLRVEGALGARARFTVFVPVDDPQIGSADPTYEVHPGRLP